MRDPEKLALNWKKRAHREMVKKHLLEGNVMEGGSVRWISKIKADFNGKKKHYPALVIIKKLS